MIGSYSENKVVLTANFRRLSLIAQKAVRLSSNSEYGRVLWQAPKDKAKTRCTCPNILIPVIRNRTFIPILSAALLPSKNKFDE